jgi:hypothetical protein
VNNDYEKYDGLMMDIVGKNNETIPYQKAIEKGMTYVRFVTAFIENDAEQLWIPRRSLSDARFPGQLDVSIRRPVFSGENYQIAVDSFIRDEMLCAPSFLDINCIGHGDPLDRIKTSVFTDVFRVRLNNIPEHYAGRFSESGFFHPQELFDRIMSGDPATDDLKKLFLNLYWKSFRELRFADLLDFDPEEKILELSGEYLENCEQSESVENARRWAESKVHRMMIEIVDETKKNYPALSPLFTNIFKNFPDKKLFYNGPESCALWIETQGIWPFSRWPEEKQFEWYEGVAKKAGIVFRRYIYKDEFTCLYRGGSDFRADGRKLISIELPGKNPSDPDRDPSTAGDSITIRRRSEREDDRETETTTVRIYDIEILPVRILWSVQDIYSAGHVGTFGSSERNITEITLSETGEVQESRKKD